MANVRLYPNTLFGRNRDEPQVWYGFVDADLGTITDPAVTSLTETDRVGPATVAEGADIFFDTTNDELDLAAGNIYRVSWTIDQTGASSVLDIYNVTGTAVLFTTPVQEGFASGSFVFRTTAAISISIRLDDQTANSTLVTTNQIIVESLGRVQT